MKFDIPSPTELHEQRFDVVVPELLRRLQRSGIDGNKKMLCISRLTICAEMASISSSDLRTILDMFLDAGWKGKIEPYTDNPTLEMLTLKEPR